MPYAQELQAALEHTPIPAEDVIARGHRTVWYTWFETFHKHSPLSCLFEVQALLHWLRCALCCMPKLSLCMHLTRASSTCNPAYFGRFVLHLGHANV